MPMGKRLAFLACFFLIAALVACDQRIKGDLLREGQIFPPLVLPGLDREPLPIDALRGKFVVLNVWATWCGPCRRELPAFERLSQMFDPQKFVVIGMTVDTDRHVAREFLREQDVSYANYIDVDGRISDDILGVRVYPDTFLISPNGTLLRSISGERPWDSSVFIESFQRAMQGDFTGLKTL